MKNFFEIADTVKHILKIKKSGLENQAAFYYASIVDRKESS